MSDLIDRMTLLRALLRADAYPHPVRDIEHLETHISDVFLTGEYAYKLKKPLDLGFLDFSTVERRRLCCEEELRLNRRLAPELYLAVVPITGSSASGVRIGGDQPIVDYAVQMRQFSQSGLLDNLAARGELTAPVIDPVAEQLAAFHSGLPPAPPESAYGSAAEIVAPALQNFDQLQPLIVADAEREALHELRAWTQSQNAALANVFEARRHDGFVRECHGDLHLGNMVLIEDRVRIFDCIEFNPHLRWIDVINEAAFFAMDLTQRGYAGLAYRFVSRYLEQTGDYAGVQLLRYYMVYRALVRAKVAAMRVAQGGVSATVESSLRDKCRAHVELALRLVRSTRPLLMITHGLSGSGKTVLSQSAVEALGAIRIRSDIERKRLHGLAAGGHTSSGVGEGIYVAAAGQATYDRLAALAQQIVSAGFPAVVDATFLKRSQRARFQALAQQYNVPFAILDVQASEMMLRRRIAERAAAGADASEADDAVLDHQLASQEPLTSAEQACSYAFDRERATPMELGQRLLDIAARVDSAATPG